MFSDRDGLFLHKKNFSVCDFETRSFQNGNQISLKTRDIFRSCAICKPAHLHTAIVPQITGGRWKKINHSAACVRQLFQSHCSLDQWFATSTSICFPTPFHLDMDGRLGFMTLCMCVLVCRSFKRQVGMCFSLSCGKQSPRLSS